MTAAALSRPDLQVAGIPPEATPATAAVCRSRLLKAGQDLAAELGSGDFLLQVGAGRAARPENPEERPTAVPAREPLFTFDQLVVETSVREELTTAVGLIRVQDLVFGEWGLRAIEPFPRSALNFYGPPGTGKTMAAHAVADRLGRQIMVASYAEVESKYHGDGPKNVKALFAAAERAGAVLFIDEADSLLSRRLTDVTQGSEQAINSMRSQLLICLEQFAGTVVFATNLIENYDPAFATRVRNIEFKLPDEAARAVIWQRHLVVQLPIDPALDRAALATGLAAEFDDLCGRDIKNAVVDAAVRAAIAARESLVEADFQAAVTRIKEARAYLPRPLRPDEVAAAETTIRQHLNSP
jgi:ATP-dependent 26S proteasome regulatory subunit